MADYNNITIDGRVGLDPETKFTTTGKMITTLSIGVSGKKQPNGYPETTWFKITAWEELAKQLQGNIEKGMYVRVNGRFGVERYTDAAGVNHEKLCVTAANLEILETPSERTKLSSKTEPDEISDDQIPF